jgi:hypothetical protein
MIKYEYLYKLTSVLIISIYLITITEEEFQKLKNRLAQEIINLNMLQIVL